MTYHTMPLAEINKLPGIVDLPVRVRSPFIKALRFESASGETTEEAMEFLDKAIAASETIKAEAGISA